MTVQAVWNSYDALHHHFKTSCEDPELKCTFLGLKKKLESPEFLLDLAIMYDTLEELAMLSKQLQCQTITLPWAEHLVKRTIRVIESFKESPGEKTQLALIAKDESLFKNVTLVPNKKIIPINRNQFLQSLADRMTSRLCSDSNSDNGQLLNDISVLHPKNIKPNDVRYGESEVRRLCRRFNVDELQAIQGLRNFTEDSKSIPDDLKPLLRTLSTLPCSTAECERGFSIMNNIITDLRASILISNVSNLMFINANGPPIDKFQPQKYVRSWLINHRSATDNRSKTSQGRDESSSRHVLWDIFLEK